MGGVVAPSGPWSQPGRSLPPSGAGRALPAAAPDPRLRARGAVARPDEVVFAGRAPDAGVPGSVRRGRAVGAGTAALIAVLATGAALGFGATSPPSPAEPREPPPAWQAELDAELEAVIRPVDAPIVAAPRVARGPGPVDVVLPAGHRFTGWRLFCWRGGVAQDEGSGELAAGQREIRIASVPPADCRVALVGEGAMSVPVTAGVTMRCTSPARQSCRRG